MLTGHGDGVITINVAEADDAEREQRRLQLHEPYRTLLGHFRHEIGHYYWDRLIAGSDRLDAFRALLRRRARRLRRGAPAALRAGARRRLAGALHQRLRQRASVGGLGRDLGALPAHDDTLETAAACGLSLRPRRADEPSLTTAGARRGRAVRSSR